MNTKRSTSDYIGIDGYRGGWVAAMITDAWELSWAKGETLVELLSGKEGALVLVDMPIGLPWRGVTVRTCDIQARGLLPNPSSVFNPPARDVLTLNYSEASQMNREITGRGLSKQSWHLCNKIIELDCYIRASTNCIVYESHPELCFVQLSELPERILSKRTTAGYQQRLEILSRIFGCSTSSLDREVEGQLSSAVKRDDCIDALALAASARLSTEEGWFLDFLGEQKQVDELGLRMQIAVPKRYNQEMGR